MFVRNQIEIFINDFFQVYKNFKFNISPPKRSTILYEKIFQDFAFAQKFFVLYKKSPRPLNEARALYIYVRKQVLKVSFANIVLILRKRGLQMTRNTT